MTEPEAAQVDVGRLHRADAGGGRRAGVGRDGR